MNPVRIEVENRPLLVFAIGLIVGLTAVALPVNLLFLVVVLYIVQLFWVRTAAVAGFLIGLSIAPAPPTLVRSAMLFDGEAYIATVVRESQTTNVVEVRSNGHRYLLIAPVNSRLEMGAYVQVHGIVRQFREGTSDLYTQRGLEGQLMVQSGDIRVVREPNVFLRLSNGMRSNFLRFIRRSLPLEPAGIVAGMCLSANDTIPEATRERLRMTGTVHLVASSGLHVLFLTMASGWVIGLLPLPRHWQLAILTAVLLFYLSAAGFHVATVRAVAMAVIAMWAYRFRRSYDLISALSLIAIVDLFIRPSDLFEIGFQLSFVTVATFGLFSNRISERNGAVFATGLSSLATLPIIAQRLGFIGLSSFFANALTVVILPFVMIGAFSAYAVSFVSPALAQGMIGFVAIPVGWFEAVLEAFGQDGWNLSVPAFSGYFLVIVYGFSLMTWRHRIVRA